MSQGSIIHFLFSQTQLQQSHARPSRPSPPDCLEWLSRSDVPLIFPPAHHSSYKIHLAHFGTWIRSSKYLQTHVAHEAALRALDDKPIILKARRAGFCPGHLHNFTAMTYLISLLSQSGMCLVIKFCYYSAGDSWHRSTICEFSSKLSLSFDNNLEK